MTLTVDELRNLQEPYETLCTGDALSEHRDELNQLSPQEMKNLASLLILGCPNEALRDYGHAIEALRIPHGDESSFHSVLSQAYEVKKRLLALADSRNKNPHLLILGAEFDDALFNNFNQLAIQVLTDNKSEIAIKLAESTPESDRNLVEKNLNKIFPGSLFTAKVGQAFAIRRDIDTLLLGDEPYQFFQSREYSEEASREFSRLFIALKDKESLVAAKLALTTPQGERSFIARGVQNIRSHDDVFATKVGLAFAIRRDIDRLLLGEKPELFFSSREFNVDSCLEFSALFLNLLKGHEQVIGEKLSQIKDSKILSDVNRKLEMLNSAAHDQNSPFRLIAAAITPKQQALIPPQLVKPRDPVKPISTTSSIGANPNNFYSGRAIKPREKLAPKMEQESCCNCFSGLFK